MTRIAIGTSGNLEYVEKLDRIIELLEELVGKKQVNIPKLPTRKEMKRQQEIADNLMKGRLLCQ